MFCTPASNSWKYYIFGYWKDISQLRWYNDSLHLLVLSQTEIRQSILILATRKLSVISVYCIFKEFAAAIVDRQTLQNVILVIQGYCRMFMEIYKNTFYFNVLFNIVSNKNTFYFKLDIQYEDNTLFLMMWTLFLNS